MRIAIIASGSRGDVEPYIALGAGLKRAGHTVRLVTNSNFAALVTDQALEFWPTRGDPQAVASSPEMQAFLKQGNFLAIMRKMGREAERGALAMAQDGLAACRGMELLLAGLGGMFTGLALAEKLDLPFIQAHYIPFTPTRAYPSFLFPQMPGWLGWALNRSTYRLAQQVMWQGLRAADRRARAEVLELPAAPFWGPFNHARLRQTPLLYCYSPSVIPKPDDWGAAVHVTGYWFLDPPAEWQPPEALLAFLQAGPPPVFVGFGSMSTGDPQATAGLILEALRLAGQRGVLLSGWEGMHSDRLPETVYTLDAIPFAWLFPRMAAVVHHGGAGTTAAGLRAGVPSIITPFFADQPYWGRRVAELGVGPQPIPRKKLTAPRLAEAILNRGRKSGDAGAGRRIGNADPLGRWHWQCGASYRTALVW